MLAALRRHWPEYLMEAAGIGLWMVAAGILTTLLEHPASAIHQAVGDVVLRRAALGIALGLVTIGLIYSPWGQQSGAHLNPVVTLTFFRLGKIEPWDTVFYLVAQFAGALLGIFVLALLLDPAIAHPAINYVATVPGWGGSGVAFLVEALISFGLMLVVLLGTNHPRLARFTGLLTGALWALYVVVAAPLSGPSTNPALTLASAVPSQLWMPLWVYFTAPPLGMLAAAEAYQRLGRTRGVICAKLNHQNNKRCIFRCGYAEQAGAGAG